MLLVIPECNACNETKNFFRITTHGMSRNVIILVLSNALIYLILFWQFFKRFKTWNGSPFERSVESLDTNFHYNLTHIYVHFRYTFNSVIYIFSFCYLTVMLVLGYFCFFTFVFSPFFAGQLQSKWTISMATLEYRRYRDVLGRKQKYFNIIPIAAGG